MSGAFVSELTYPCDGKTVLVEMAKKTGVPIVTTNLPDGVMIPKRAVSTESTTDESGNPVTDTKYVTPFDGYTYREALSYIAQFYGMFATMDRVGNVVFRWYTAADCSISADRYYDDLTLGESVFTVEKIVCQAGNDTLSAGEGTACMQLENPVMTQERLTAVYQQIKALEFLPASVSFLGDPRIDMGDIITVTDKTGKVVKIPVMSLVQDYDGGLLSEVQSFGKSESVTAQSKGPTAQKLDRVYTDLFLVKEIVGGKASFDYVYGVEGNFKNLSGDYLSFKSGEFEDLKVKQADFETATAKNFSAQTAQIKKLSGDFASFKTGDFESLKSKQADFETATAKNFTATSARIDTVTGDLASYKNVVAENFSAANGKIENLETTTLKAADAKLTYATIDSLNALKGDITDLNVGSLTARVATIEGAYISKTETKQLLAGYADIKLANVAAGTIGSALIGDGAITDAKIASVSANKLTAGTIDAAKITVINLNADNLTVGKINGKLIGTGTVDLDKLSKEVPTKAYLDSVQNGLQSQIDNAIQTYVVDTIPTLKNAPASSWTDNSTRAKHVGDICYVTNAGGNADGYCYRFTNTGTSANPVYEWVLIKDSDVNKALQELVTVNGDLTGLKSFQSETSSWRTSTDTEISSVKTRTTTIETTYSTKGYTDSAKSSAIASSKTYTDTVTKDMATSTAVANAKKEAIATAAKDASSKASTAQSTAISEAAKDATSKADAAKSSAISAAATDATKKADAAKSSAISAAATDATTKANTAKSEAISTAASDATKKANDAKSAAISAASSDATSKANTAKSEAISAAASDATTKANAALNSAKGYADDVVDNIAVGGRNLLVKTNQGATCWSNSHANGSYSCTSITWLGVNAVKMGCGKRSTSWKMFVYNITVGQFNKLKPGGSYVLSYDTDGGSSANFMSLMSPSGISSIVKTFTQTAIKTNYGYHYTIKIVLNDTLTWNNQTVYLENNLGSGESVIIANIKLEEGNKATPWTPAPEDTEEAINTKVSTTVFNEVKQTVDSNSATITKLSETVTTKANSSSVTALSNTVNSVKQTADSNSANISELSKTVSAKADGSSVTALTTRMSNAEQNLDGFKTTVSKTYVTSQTYNEKVANLESGISAAQGTADSATKTANTAKSTADSATTTANTAKSTADTASKTASAAKSTAEGAVSTANTANKTASSAKSTADSAAATANSAKSTADSASSTANAASSKADSANSTANSALSAANSAKEYTDAVASQYGYRYGKDIIIYGDKTDYYYPVYFAYGNQKVSREVLIIRGYNEQAPNTWGYGDGSHNGALTLKIRAVYGGWGGAEYKCEIVSLSEMYCQMIGDIRVGTCSGYGMTVWLRGGGNTGAIYHIFSDQEIEYDKNNMWHATIPYIGLKEGVQFGWTEGTESNPVFKWITDAPLASPNRKHLNELQALDTANSALTKADSAVERQYTQYYRSTSTTTPTGGTWLNTVPDLLENTCIWTRQAIVHVGGDIEYSDPVLDSVTKKVVSMSAEVTKTAEGLTSTANKVTTLTNDLAGVTTRLGTAESKITQNAESISAKVSTTDFNSFKTSNTTAIDSAKNSAISTAASDATKKANDAKSSAISTAASDATTKANNALSSAKSYSDGQIKTVNAAITQTNSEISAMKGQIALKVEQTDINKAVNGIEIGGRNLIRNGDFSSDFSNYWAGENISSGAEICRDSSMGCNFVRVATASRIYNKVENVWNKGQNYTVSYWARKAPSIVAISKYENTGKVSDFITITSVSDTAITLACTKPTGYAFIAIDLTNIFIPGITYELSFVASGKNESISIDEATDSNFSNRTLISQKVMTAVSGRYYRMKIYANVGENASTETYTNAYTNIYLRPVNDAQKLTPSRSLIDCGEGSILSYEWQKYVDSISCTVTAEGGSLSFSTANKAVIFEITKVKLEKGNKATDWTPAPEDDEERLSSLESWKSEASLKITKDGIIGTVGSYYATGADVTALTGRVTQAESTIKQHSDSIALTVKKDGVISAINQTSESVKISANKISLTAAGLVEIINSGDTKIKAANLNLSATDVVNIINSGTTKISADKLNLSGYVTVSSLSGSGTTTIDGSNIKTGKISTDRLDVDSIFAKKVNATNLHVTGNSTIDGKLVSSGINASNITTGTISADRLDVTGIFAKDVTATGSITGATIVGGALGTVPGDYGMMSLERGSLTAGWSLNNETVDVIVNASFIQLSTSTRSGNSVSTGTDLSISHDGIWINGVCNLSKGNNQATFSCPVSINSGLNATGNGTFGGDISATRGLTLKHNNTSLYIYNESGTFCIMHTGTDGKSSWPILWNFASNSLAVSNALYCSSTGSFDKGITSKAESVFHTGSYTDPYPGKSCTIKSWGTVASLRFAAKGISNTWLGAAKPDGAAYDTINTDAGALVPGWRVRTADGAWVGASYAQDPGFRIYYCNASRLGGSTNGTDAIYTFGSSGTFYAKSVSQTSDEREKNILSGITEKYEDLFMRLKPVLFNWKTGADGIHMGFGAQTTLDIAEKCGISPNELAAVHKSETEEPWSMSYTEIVPLTVQMTQKALLAVNSTREEMQKAITSIDSTRKEVSALESSMTARMESLQYQLAQAFDRIAALEKENKLLRQALS